MAVINIKNVDDQLAAEVKSKAALERKTVRNVVIGLLEGYICTPVGSQDLNAAHCPVNGPIIGEDKNNNTN